MEVTKVVNTETSPESRIGVRYHCHTLLEVRELFRGNIVNYAAELAHGGLSDLVLTHIVNIIESPGRVS